MDSLIVEILVGGLVGFILGFLIVSIVGWL